VTREPRTKPSFGPAAPSYLDLIKEGSFNLKKVDKSEVRPPVKDKKQEPKDPSTLTVQEILQQAAAIREAVACSDSSEDESEETTTSW
jgi:hypothetical protein